jgi:diaminopimelate decarboxylase
LTDPTSPARPTTASFAVEDGVLVVGGVRLDRLADRVGGTPFFAYDRGLLSARVAELRRRLPADLELRYAVKANPMPAVVQHLRGLVDGFDVASASEMKTALDTGMPAERTSFAGPGKTESELAQAVAAGVTVEVESETQLETVAAVGGRRGVRPRVAVRVNPSFEVKGSGMRMGGAATQFGVDSERVPELLGRIGKLPVEFLGFHVFCGSQNLQLDVLCETQTKTAELMRDLSKHAPSRVRYLNMGGGFGIPYFENDKPLDLAALGANLERVMAEIVRPAFPDCRVVVELGRYVVGECGVYVSRIIDRKTSRGQTFLVVDGGMHHQLAASGNFGQVIRRNYPVAVGNRMGAASAETVSVVGCLCTPLDLLANKAALPRAEIGDLFVVFQSGAYGLTASPTAFLSHPAAQEVLVG